MKLLRNSYIPLKGYKAMMLFGILFVRGNAVIDDTTLRHEGIHVRQMRELLYLPFYILYLVEWLAKLPFYGAKAYRSISFEREAYDNQACLGYPSVRRPFAWVKRILK
jgi:hypothetical protein